MKQEGVTRSSSITPINKFSILIYKTTDSVSAAVAAMIKADRYRALVTVENDKLLGLITMSDLINPSA